MKIVRKDLSNAYPINLVESITYKKPINETELNNSNGRPLGMVSIMVEELLRSLEGYANVAISGLYSKQDVPWVAT
jgi:hypothetical protein